MIVSDMPPTLLPFCVCFEILVLHPLATGTANKGFVLVGESNKFLTFYSLGGEKCFTEANVEANPVPAKRRSFSMRYF